MSAPKTLLSKPCSDDKWPLVWGFAEICAREALQRLAQRPLIARRFQEPPDFGLFDLPARNQLDFS